MWNVEQILIPLNSQRSLYQKVLLFFLQVSGYGYIHVNARPAANIAKAKSSEASKEKRNRKLNLLGVTPLDFGPQPMVDAMKKRLEERGWEILSTWAMGDTLEDLAHAGEAEVNLAVSSVGIPAANVLKEKFGTPFLVGTPLEFQESLTTFQYVLISFVKISSIPRIRNIPA